ncbi:hypothetical protein C7T35_25865 [Variovorax sp. WS11]|uniref:hypothetical protein n=1 Tax=Variovorax sp. WS11 TaxID=1105204 RepID=UPI000D0DD9C5|nr:hypothetical protein [Variovorax sp. WS11]NDZ18381.1 hypothetical protein [Variovorax sp. WS11]PSL81677.1 hypothetical protein C7T35_25865 [Variovorax sp. WS11]
MLTFSTLGLEGSNHHFVLRQYLDARGIAEATRIVLFDDFHSGARALIAGEADYLLQCAVHPAAAEITGTYRAAMVVVDAFISPSRPMALVRATGSGEGTGRVAVQPATQSYADLSAWSTVVHEPTVLAVQARMAEGRYEAGIVFSSFAAAHPERFELIEPIGAICDAWIVYGREAVDEDRAVVWESSPVARQFRERMGQASKVGGS